MQAITGLRRETPGSGVRGHDVTPSAVEVEADVLGGVAVEDLGEFPKMSVMGWTRVRPSEGVDGLPEGQVPLAFCREALSQELEFLHDSDQLSDDGTVVVCVGDGLFGHWIGPRQRNPTPGRWAA